MKHLLICLTGVCSFCFSTAAFAGENHFFQQPSKDSLAPRLIEKASITVKDLMDGEGLDSVYVVVGNKKGYTDSKGFISFDSVSTGSMVFASKNGYLVQSKKSKTGFGFSSWEKRIAIICKRIQ